MPETGMHEKICKTATVRSESSLPMGLSAKYFRKKVESGTPPTLKPANIKCWKIKMATFEISKYLMTGGNKANPPNIEGRLNLNRWFWYLSFCVLNIPIYFYCAKNFTFSCALSRSSGKSISIHLYSETSTANIAFPLSYSSWKEAS